MTLLICPVRPGDSNEELRYALRSWETNLLLPDLTLLTVGHKPSWVNPDDHINGNQYDSMPFAVFDNIQLASAYVASFIQGVEVVFMNDDFFCMDPMNSLVTVKRNQSLAQHLALFPEGAGLWWPRSLRLTADWLADKGFTHPDSWEVHRPLVADAQAMLRTLDLWDLGSSDTVPQWRTMYGVYNRVVGYPVQDCKLGMKNTGIGSPWISTSDGAHWRRYAASLAKRFQKPSRWEIT